MTSIIMLQKKVVQAIEQGKDPAPALKALADYRANQEVQKELAELSKVAEERQALKDRAKGIKAKVEKQSKAISKFLEARDSLVKQLQPLLEPMGELSKLGASAWELEPGECYLYNDIGQFGVEARSVPSDYLKDFGCPFLSMNDGITDARGKASEAYQYLSYALGILRGFTKEISQIDSGKADNPLLDNVDVAGGCSVCSHPEVAGIDKALKDSVSLRTIEANYKVSRSSLSRHKNRCLNEGAIKVVD